MRFFVVGCSYRSSPLALREKLAFTSEEIPQALGDLRAQAMIEESLLLSTCNRVEVYGVSSKPSHACRDTGAYLVQSRGVTMDQLQPSLYELKDREALRHIFRVTASLDAMVVGEAQISGQVKEAYHLASQAGTVGPLLSRCIHRAFAAAKHIRNETDIARHPVSVSSVAADLAARVFGELAGSTVLVIGAGEMAELAARHLLSDGASDIRVINRTHQRAVQLAFQLGAKAAPFDQLQGQLLLADIVITSTGSPQPILPRKLISAVMRQRKQRPLFLVDIAVPRDVEPGVRDLANVYLFDVDDLEQVVAENRKERQRAARQAERILDVELDHFTDWLRAQDAVPVIKDLRAHFTRIVEAETEHAAQALHLHNGEQRRLLGAMTNAIVNKLLHDPIVELKKQANTSGGTFLARSTRVLFHLADPDQQPGEPPSDRSHSEDSEHADQEEHHHESQEFVPRRPPEEET